ncbi:thiamine phosphate synthase [Flavobacteriaceae bacterium]|nr:thiamine phosphate synthase [Flavobacteriaceae bacterium]MDB9874462.1 thiamine phosphate synthase [Flavobacteriaceae bacterium]
MIPKLHYISQGNSPKAHLDHIQNACAAGVELVVLDIQNSSEKKYLKIAKQAIEITSHFQTRLIISAHFKLAKELKVDGIHLDKSTLCPTAIRKELLPWQLIGATANNLQDCETFIEKEVDYIYLEPFKTTEDTQGTQLGLNGYTAIIDTLKTETPIIGVGGITTSDVTAILETGVSGVGVSDEITEDFNTIKIFNQLLTASSTDEQRHSFQ